MNYTKLKKEKLELDYGIKKIDNILDCEENLERYIEIIENDKFEAPSNLNIKILEKLKIEEKGSKEKDDIKVIKLQKHNKEDYKNIGVNNVENSSTRENSTNDKFIKRIKYKFTDILKIAACTVFALMIWEITPTNTTYAKKTPEVVTDEENKNIKSDFNLKRKVNDFFMSPIKIERREK